MVSDFVSADMLLHALSNGEFYPYLQPIVSTSDFAISGVELLARWHISEGNVISPACFISPLESAGLLLPMTKKVMSQAIASLSDISDVLPSSFFLTVNVTPTMLADSEFAQMCLVLIDKSRIHLVLELTEQEPFYIGRQTEQMLCRLSDSGVKFALDDFGTGCSVLSYLKYFPVSYIKIDKTFTHDVLSEMTSRYIVESVVGLTKKLGIHSVAEGIEFKEQVNFLNSIGVDYFQGFYFGKPEKVADFCGRHSRTLVDNR